MCEPKVKKRKINLILRKSDKLGQITHKTDIFFMLLYNWITGDVRYFTVLPTMSK